MQLGIGVIALAFDQQTALPLDSRRFISVAATAALIKAPMSGISLREGAKAPCKEFREVGHHAVVREGAVFGDECVLLAFPIRPICEHTEQEIR